MNNYIKNINSETKKLTIGITIRTIKNFDKHIFCSGIEDSFDTIYEKKMWTGKNSVF